MKYTELPSECFEALATNAGILLSEFSPNTGEYNRNKILGATSGGINVTCVPTYSDWGEDVDNAPKNTKELKHIDSWECKMTGTFISVTSETFKMLIGACETDTTDSGITEFTPKKELLLKYFKNVWYVCNYGNIDGGFIAVKLVDAISTGGFSLQSTDNGKGQFAFEFTGHSSTESVDTVPMEFYMNKPESEVSTSSEEEGV